tara:strand:- start:21 stop:431 length:411 start_codon:yes stop_codon:yes gene_type:complete
MAEVLKEARTKVIHKGERTIKENKKENAIEYCERLYPETTKEFQKILDEMYETFCKKQRNYGPGNISVGSNLESDDDIKLSLVGLWFRKNDKIQRLKQLVVLGQPDEVGENIQDTYEDLSVYGIISQIVQRKKWAK